MTLKIPVTLLKNCTLENKDLVQSSRRTTQMFLEVEHRHISEKDRNALFLACQGQQDKTPELKRLQRQLKSLLDIARNPKGTKVQTLGAFKDALTLLLKELPNKWVYRFDKELRRWAPYFVERIKESSPTRYGLPSVDLEMAAVLLGERTEEKTYFHNCDIRGKMMAHILEDAGIRTETRELNAEFQEHLDLFHKYTKKEGEQFTAVAWVQTRESENSWQPEVYHVPVDPERPAQLVMDHTSIARPSKDELHADASFWEEQADYDQETSTEKGDEAISLPEHPIVYMYDLQAHEEVIVHIADIAPYKYQTEIGKLLVLPKDEKRLLEVLREGIHLSDRDVISGKTGGCLIIIRGDPGLGKTLSAQVFAEENERPLYEVQCAQLGIQPAEVEKNLRKALLRARRWNAILLINEADVYVRKRGEDIVQNAIVGVFLRLLESLDGICFLTTNQGTTIDDAIYSRAMVHLKYDYPDEEGRFAICRDQSKLQKLPITDEVARALTKKHRLSGRDIRQLVKLARLLHLSEGNSIQLKDLEWALQWRDTGLKKKKSG
jgi:hypothetical protein